jgi:hypothetical protein
MSAQTAATVLQGGHHLVLKSEPDAQRASDCHPRFAAQFPGRRCFWLCR